MFEIGEYIVYGGNGVHRVEKIGNLDIPGLAKDKLYYTLSSIYSPGGRVYTAVDNEKVNMRLVMTKEEAYHLIDSMPNTEVLGIEDEKKRELVYKEAVRACNSEELVKIIKTLYARRQQRIQEGKKVMACDEKYKKLAEDALYGELAIALGMEKSEVEQFIMDRIEDL